METAERQVHMGIQTDGCMKRSTCFLAPHLDTRSVILEWKEITGEFNLTRVTRHLLAMEVEIYQCLASEPVQAVGSRRVHA